MKNKEKYAHNLNAALEAYAEEMGQWEKHGLTRIEFEIWVEGDENMTTSLINEKEQEEKKKPKGRNWKRWCPTSFVKQSLG